MADDFSANTSTSGRLSLGGYATGIIENTGDIDWFRITLSAGQQVRFDLEGSPTGRGTLTDSYLRGIYNSSGILLANTSNDDISSGNANSAVVFTAASSGDYYLAAGAYSSLVGTYRLSATLLAQPDDYLSTTATTGRLTLGSATTGNIGSNGDTDWFKIALNAGQKVRFDLEGSPTGRGTLSDTVLRGIYDGSGNLLANTVNDDYAGSPNSAVFFTATSTGNYYVSAGAYTGLTGTYRLSATAVTSTDDYSSTTATAGRLALNNYATGYVDSSGDTDWFKISLSAGQLVRFDLEGSPTNMGSLTDTYLRGIYNSSGVLVANTTNNDFGGSKNSAVTFKATTTGDYYVAAGANGTFTGSYVLSAALDDFTAGTSTTGRLVLGSYATGNIAFNGDTDWFKISLNAGQLVKFDLEGSPTNRGTLTDPYLYGIYNSSGTLLANTANNDFGSTKNASVTFKATTSGDYYVAAGATGNLIGSYRLSAMLDDYGSSTSTAGSMTLGGSTSGNINFTGDTDWFKIHLDHTQAVRLVLTATDPGGSNLSDPTLSQIFDANGNLVPSSYYYKDTYVSSRESAFMFTARSSGDYYVATGGVNGQTGSYTLTSYKVYDDSPNDGVDAQWAITVGNSQNHSIDYSGDTDWINITLAAGQRIHVSMQGTPYNQKSALADPNLVSIRDSNGNVLVNYSTENYAGSSLNFVATYTGVHYIVVGSNSGSTGGYTVAVTSMASATTKSLASSVLQQDPAYALAQTQATDDFLVYNGTDGKLYYEDDGSVADAGVQLARLGTNLALTADDFMLGTVH